MNLNAAKKPLIKNENDSVKAKRYKSKKSLQDQRNMLIATTPAKKRVMDICAWYVDAEETVFPGTQLCMISDDVPENLLHVLSGMEATLYGVPLHSFSE